MASREDDDIVGTAQAEISRHVAVGRESTVLQAKPSASADFNANNNTNNRSSLLEESNGPHLGSH